MPACALVRSACVACRVLARLRSVFPRSGPSLHGGERFAFVEYVSSWQVHACGFGHSRAQGVHSTGMPARERHPVRRKQREFISGGCLRSSDCLVGACRALRRRYGHCFAASTQCNRRGALTTCTQCRCLLRTPTGHNPLPSLPTDHDAHERHGNRVCEGLAAAVPTAHDRSLGNSAQLARCSGKHRQADAGAPSHLAGAARAPDYPSPFSPAADCFVRIGALSASRSNHTATCLCRTQPRRLLRRPGAMQRRCSVPRQRRCQRSPRL